MNTTLPLIGLVLFTAIRGTAQPTHDWQAVAPRAEIRPAFSFDPKAGPKRVGSLVIAHDHREGLAGSLVSSTFMAPKDGWMVSVVFDPTGRVIAHADTWGTVAVAEVDLSQPYVGPYNLGDFRAMVPRHRPVAIQEPAAVLGLRDAPRPGTSRPEKHSR